MAELRARVTQELVSGVENGDLMLVRDALDRGGDPQVGGRLCLVREAARCGYHHLLSCLLEAGLNPEGRGTYSSTPLILAAMEDHKYTVEALLRQGANPQARDIFGRTALHYAAWRGHVECVETLVGVTPRPPRGEVATTPLHLACREGYLSVVKVMQAAGWPLHTRDSAGSTALHCAALSGSVELMQHLLKAGLDPHVQCSAGQTALHCAARGGNVKVVQRLVNAGLDPHAQDSDGQTALHCAARGGSVEVVQHLVKAGLDTHVQDSAGKTALHWAACGGSVEVFQHLVEAGVDPHVKDSNGQTALHCAALSGSVEVVQYLVKEGVNPHMKDNAGRTALHCAAQFDSVEMVQHLLEAGVEPHVQDRAGQTALHWAARCASVQVMQHLMDAGLDPHVQDRAGNTALHWSARCESAKAFQHLVGAGLDPLVKDHHGHTPLDVARNRSRLTDIQLTSAAKEHVRERSDATPVNVMGYIDKVRRQRGSDELHHRHIVSLIKAGHSLSLFLDVFPVHAVDKDGLTLLHYAAQCQGATACIKELLMKGATIHVMTPDGTTPADLARRGDHKEALEAMSRHQCCKGDTTRDELYHKLLSTIGREDDVRKVSSLLCQGAPLQPLGSGTHFDLECGSIQALRLAVSSGRRGSVLLLLASGAKLPASLLQEAWQNRDVNVEVLADLTTAYCCRFSAERRRAKHSTELVHGIDHLLETIAGDAPWDAAWPSNSPQELSRLLGEAAPRDCPLTAGFLSLAGAWPSLSGEWGASALHAALEAGKSSLAEVLVRDLGGSLYIPDAACRLPRDLLPVAERRRLEELQFLKERSKLQDLDILQDIGHRQLTARQALAIQEELYECFVEGRTPASLITTDHRIALLLAARRGLPQLMFLVLHVGGVLAGRVVDHGCGTTALHEAASHGRGICVALLLCQEANRQPRDKYGQTPSLLAAMFGHKNMRHLLEQGASMDYLACRAGTTPKQVSHNFDSYLQTYEKCGSEVRKSLTLVDRRHSDAFTHKLLQGISLPQLQQEAEEAHVDFSEGEALEVKEAVMAELRAIMDKVARADAMYRGELFLAGSSLDGSKLYAPDEFDVNVVIKVDNVTVSVEETERLLRPRKGGKKLSVRADNPGLEGDKFVTNFFSLVQETLAEHQLQDIRLSLVPPGLTSTQVGVALALAWQGREYPLLLVGVDLVPVLKVPWHQEVARPQLTPPDAAPVMYLSNAAGGSWRCSFALVEAAVLKHMNPEERRPYLMGKTLLCCHKAEQWIPRLSSYTRNTWLASGHWKSRVPNGFSYKNAFLRWLEQRRLEEAEQEEDPVKVLVDIFRQMCINPEAAAQDLQASSSPAYFGGDCEAPKSGKGAPLIVQWLEGELEKGKTLLFESSDSDSDSDSNSDSSVNSESVSDYELTTLFL